LGSKFINILRLILKRFVNLVEFGCCYFDRGFELRFDLELILVANGLKLGRDNIHLLAMKELRGRCIRKLPKVLRRIGLMRRQYRLLVSLKKRVQMRLKLR
jgi:hypothetical protein